MQERARGLEIASCIISIAVGALFFVMGITSAIAMAGPDFDLAIEETYELFLEMGLMLELSEFVSMFRTVMIMLIVVYLAGGAALIVLSALIIKRMKKLAVQRKLRTAYTIVTGVIAFIMFFGGVTADILSVMALMALIAAFVLENVFLSKNKPKRVIYITPRQSGYGAPQSGGMPDIFGGAPATQNGGMPDIFGEAEKKTDTLDQKISDLKRLHDEGVLTDEQYAQAVEKIIREESQK